jgi:GAF domain-containing protein/class 3 adenylate cyclase/two-component SAPR family response regulator
MTKPSSKKAKILVVDDEPDNLDLLYRTFYREFEILRAESGPAALEILEQQKGNVAVIISDQRMPSMSGTEFLSLTATQYPDIIRIILTGYTDVEDLVEAINSGKVFKYVTKPWDDAELKTVVRQAVDTHLVLRARTQDLQRTLRQESLLNAVTNTIRQAMNYRQILQTIVDTVGQVFDVDYCILRPFQDHHMTDELCLYARGSDRPSPSALPPHLDELMHTVTEVHEVQVVDDVATDDRTAAMTLIGQSIRAIYQAADIQASLTVPLIYQQELVAVLVLMQCQHPRHWRDDEVQLVVMVSDQAALSLAQARTYEQMTLLARREALVNTITAAIRSSLDPQDIFAAITEQLGQALHTDGCALSLWTKDDEYVQCVGLHDATLAEASSRGMGEAALTPEGMRSEGAGTGSEPPLDWARHSLPQSKVPIEGNPVLQQLLATQEPVMIDDLDEHPEKSMPDLPLRSPARALLVVPLIYDGEIIGSISLRQIHTPRHWLPDEVQLAQAVAVQAAIAVQQAHLYQKTRQQADQLLELDRQKNEFFQNVSHEFRTPLTLTIGPLESAIAQEQGLSYDQSRIALRNSRRLLRLVNQLLDLQRLDAGRMQPRFRPCNLLDVVTQIVESFQHYCERKQIHLSTELEDCPPVYLDLEKFDKVLYNLLSNAIKFTAPEGQIVVTLKAAGDHCLLQIRDSGIGIRPDQIPYLFERFRQADGSANRKYEGSGLGLALVKKLVEMHGGKVMVDSVYGEGSTFTVWLQTGTAHLPPDQIIEVPSEIEGSRSVVELADIEADQTQGQGRSPALNAASPARDGLAIASAETGIENGAASGEDHQGNYEGNYPVLGIPPGPPSASGRSRVLVVDDNIDLRAYVSGILHQSGYEVILARDGAEGFRLAETYQPHLILTDLMMPQVSGLEMIRMLRQQETLKGIPIVLLTAKADEDTRIEGVEEGADAYLSKPFNERELLAEVRNLLALKQNERQVAALNQYLTESVLRRFLPPSLVKRAARGELSLQLRPEPKLVTVLFSDIVGFTQLSNTLRSRRVAELLNEYLAAMTHAIFANGGTVDKFMGDAILAIFGSPEEMPPNEQVKRAIAAAQAMYAALEGLNARWRAQGIPQDVQFRCGIHQGTAVVGMFGNEERSDYTAIGPSVNIAARIQEAAEPGTILVSAAVADYLNLEDDAAVKCRPLQLKGIEETVLTFEIQVQPLPAPSESYPSEF